MFKKLYLYFLFFCCSFLPFFAHAQADVPSGMNPVKAFSISGTITDTANFSNTGYTSVSAIRTADSLLVAFTRADESGKFKLYVDSPATYLLLISHPSFAMYVDEVAVSEKNTDLPPINLTSKKQLLNEVIITDARAIVLKGDTTEYTADSFKTRAFDNVDELLKRLPGIEIGKDGKIKAYGKEVKNMTVDGEEFFSDDPAIVAKTLRASAVDKVQVFDKKSDQATFTGIEDGELEKTINLKLKEDAKKGYFGKASLGGGLPSYWENQLMVNAFNKKRKVAVYGIMSNTNNNGLGWEDRGKYGGSSNSWSEGDDGNWVMEGAGDLGGISGWDGQYSGEGLPRTWTGGAMYSNKFMNDSLSLNANYKYGKIITEGYNNTRSQYILPDTQYVSNNNSSKTTIGKKQLFAASSKYIIDSASSISVSVSGNFDDALNKVANKSESTSMDGELINDNNSRQDMHQLNKSMKANVDYNRRFKRKGQTFAASVSGNWTDNSSDGTLQSVYNLYALDSAYALNQTKQNTSSGLTGGLKLAYTHPVNKEIFLNFNYKLGLNKNKSENNTSDRHIVDGAYEDDFNPLYSSRYEFNNMQNYGGVGMRFDYKNLKFGFNANLSQTNFRQKDLLFDTSYNYAYSNFLPNAFLRFEKSRTTSYSFRYNTSFRPPSMYQLQPLRNNTDPLNITIGNPALKPSYTHRVSLNYNNYKVLSSRSLYAGASFSSVQNDVSQMQNIDISGRNVTEFINVDGNYSADGNLGYSKMILKKVQMRFNLWGNLNHNNNFINGAANVNNSFSLSPGLDLSYYKDTTFNVSYGFRPSYNYNNSSLRTDYATKYWTYNQSFDASINLPHKVTIGTDIDWNIRQRLDPQDKNNNVFKWNAYAQKAFLKDRSLVARVSANDILNQNQGYNRYNTATFISESTYNTIQRYFMLTLTWNFTKSGAKSTGGSEVDVVD